MTQHGAWSVIVGVGLATASSFAGAQPWLPVAEGHRCGSLCEEAARLERAIFDLLPGEHRLAIARGMMARGQLEQARVRATSPVVLADRASWRPEWRRAMEFYERNGNPGVMTCFSPDTDPEIVHAFSQMLFGTDTRFQINNRWSTTAYSGGGLGQGDPTVISYSFVPDGTTVADAGYGSGPSQLFAWMNGIYGSPAVWQDLFHAVFDRWAEISGLSFVFEPTDDGATQSTTTNPGVPGVRGDVRIAAKNIDGNGGILAYNFFPNNGDMVLDAFDSFYNNTGGNSIRLRNIVSHEFGHGMGSNHVCPSNGTKLMEPFINTGFDGPQLDDTLMVQRLYGDRFETNDTPGTATALGAVSVLGLSTLSVDGSGDVDWYSVTINEASDFTVTVTPTGATYTQGPQTSQCNTGTSFDSLRVRDLGVQLIGTDGSTVLATADSNGLGIAETATVVVETPGTYFVRVFGAGADNIQAYSMQVLVEELPYLPARILIEGTLPDALQPGQATPVAISVIANDEVIAPGSVALRFRASPGPFQSIPLSDQGAGIYAAALPGVSCDETPEFYFEIEGDLSGLITLPPDGPATPFSAIVGTVETAFEDDFSTDLGWVVGAPGDNATSGIWERVNPVGTTTGGQQVQPNGPLFGSACYVTGQHPVGQGVGASDVDNGRTTLLTPLLDLSELSQPVTISYWRWYSNSAGASPNTDIFEVDISPDGGATWTSVEVVGPSGPETTGGWFQYSFDPASLIPLTDAVRMRFIASDTDPQSLVEAAVDGFRIEGRSCEDPAGGPCNAADLSEPFGVLDLADVNAFVDAFINQQPPADLSGDGVFDLADINLFGSAFVAGCP